MAKVGVFFSYDFTKDKELYGSFFAQAKGESRHAIRNYSMNKVHPPDDWKVEAEKRIAQCSLVITVVGQDTHSASGVEEERNIAKRLGKKRFQIQPRKQNYGGLNGAGEIIPWKWDRIDAKINGLLELARQ